MPAGMCADAMCGRYVLQKVLFVAIDTYLRRCYAWQVQVSGGAVCGRYVLYAVLVWQVRASCRGRRVVQQIRAA